MGVVGRLFGKRIHLPVNDTWAPWYRVYVPEGHAPLTPTGVRELAETWCSTNADSHARDYISRLIDSQWGSSVTVVVDSPDTPEGQPPPSEDPPCWTTATESQRRVVTTASQVVRIASPQIPGREPLGLMTSLAMAYAVVEESGGVIYDPIAARFAPQFSRPLTLELKLSEHITFVASTDAQDVGTMSTRLWKFGLRGLTWTGYRGWMQRQILPVANAVAGVLVHAVEQQCVNGAPPSEIRVPGDIELTLEDVGRVYRHFEKPPAAHKVRGRTRIGLRTTGDLCEVVPPSSFRGAPAEWAPHMLEELTGVNPRQEMQRVGLMTLADNQRLGWNLADPHDAAALEALGRVAVEVARKR